MELGYKPAAAELSEEMAAALAKQKHLFNIVEPEDLVPISDALADRMEREYLAELAAAPEDGPRALLEWQIAKLKPLQVEMFFDEGQHSGRPHVKVTLEDGAMSVSLERPPVVLTPNPPVRGQRAALKTIGRHRKYLLVLWHDTRPDTQRLARRSKRRRGVRARLRR